MFENELLEIEHEEIVKPGQTIWTRYCLGYTKLKTEVEKVKTGSSTTTANASSFNQRHMALYRGYY